MTKAIITVPHPLLATPAKPVTFFDKRLTKLIQDMKDTLISTGQPKGVGLAATQIGVPYQLFLAKPTDRARTRVFINPVVTFTPVEESTNKQYRDKRLEGCLSIPNIWGKLERAPSIFLKYVDETGKIRQETISGFLATIVQHEVDHLRGVLFTQRVLEQHGKLYQAKKNREGKKVLEEISLQ